MITSIMSGKKLDIDSRQSSGAPKLEFESTMREAKTLHEGEELRSRAMHNLKERRLRLK